MSATISPSDAVFGRMSPAVPARSAQDAAVSFADLPEKAPPRSVVRDLPEPAERELRLQRVLIAYVVAGLFFMLLPGTVLGVWNLISISSRHALDALSPAWLQAHGHAQIFGWIGTFILGIGFYSLSKMGQCQSVSISRAWIAFALWITGVASHWIAGVTGWHWRILLPGSAALELAGFLIFFRTVSRHRPTGSGSGAKREPWMFLVIASSFGFLASLVLNASAVSKLAWDGVQPALPHVVDQRIVALEVWCFLIPAIWGFNARWLPVFLGLKAPNGRLLFASLAAVWISVFSLLFDVLTVSAILLPLAAGTAVYALQVWRRPVRAPKIAGVHPSFPFFVRAAYAWLLIGAGLWLAAVFADRSGGIWGAARHALTVGYISTMVFAIGQRVLPAFGGARRLYSSRLMFASLAALMIGCSLRVASEIPAYEGYSQSAWHLLPCSAVIELLAVFLFAANMVMTFLQPPAHLQERPA